MQLRHQETVEGLSVAAITYYVVSLIIYLTQGAEELGSPINPYLAGMITLPFVAGIIWYGVRRVRKGTQAWSGSGVQRLASFHRQIIVQRPLLHRCIVNGDIFRS